ncbi:Ger(x)C family spore germination protein [Priestia aryabhattai]|nr:hypothetical protein CHH47_28070 [Priestia megaterium]
MNEMRWSMVKVLFFFPLFLLTGCWDKYELTERGFVQAVGIDLTEEGEIQLTTQFYKPAGGSGGGAIGQGGGESRFFNLKTIDGSVFEAARDISIHLGRKAQWSHMRVIVISEELAKEKNISDILEFFTRDHEPRETISIIIAKGKASDYFGMKPIIESTLGEHLRRIQETTPKFTLKTIESNLLQINSQLKSETGIALASYMYIDEKNEPPSIVIAGAVLIKNGKIEGFISPQNMQRFLMLINQPGSGILEIPCADRTIKNSFEVVSVKTKMKPKIMGNSTTVHVTTKIEGSIAELNCYTVETTENEKEFAKAVEKLVKQEMETLIEQLQNQKLDAIGIGNIIYRNNPKLWGDLEKDWGEHFADIRFMIDVKVKVRDTGMNTGKSIIE